MVDLIHAPSEVDTGIELIDDDDTLDELSEAENLPTLPLLENELTDERYELIEGQLVTMARTDNEHGAICARIIGQLWLYSAQIGQKARIHDSSAAFYTRANTRTARKPDVAFTFHRHLPSDIQSQEDYMRVPPDLVVEVISPGNSAIEIEAKTQEWFSFGVKLVWLVYSEVQRVHIYSNADSSLIVRGDGKIDGRDILPGFETPLAPFFHD